MYTPCTLFIAKTWINLLVDDFEAHHKFEKIKKIKINSLV
jgi:hypothetical protein